jgi:hypothetical protein
LSQQTFDKSYRTDYLGGLRAGNRHSRSDFAQGFLVLLEKFACPNLSRRRLSDDHVDVLAPGCGADGEHTLGQRLGDLVAGDLDDLLLDELVELFADLSHLIF